MSIKKYYKEFKERQKEKDTLLVKEQGRIFATKKNQKNLWWAGSISIIGIGLFSLVVYLIRNSLSIDELLGLYIISSITAAGFLCLGYLTIGDMVNKKMNIYKLEIELEELQLKIEETK